MSRALQVVLILILIMLLLGFLPVWPYRGGWGYFPSGGLGVLLVIVAVVMVLERQDLPKNP